MSLYPVIMAGGSGTRFWPLSRKLRPKQFLPLASKLPLINDTVKRMEGLAPLSNTYVVCGRVHAPRVRAMVKRLPAKNVLVEPQARNTAPAIGLAAATIAARDPDAVLIVLPSDHHIADVPGFQRVLEDAAAVAREGFLVTIGITPNRPETGYGYIRVGQTLSGKAKKVAAFVEKPDAATAEGYLASGDYLWNAGIFVFRADTILSAFATHMPETEHPLEAIRAAARKKNAKQVVARMFPRLTATSIDYGVMEKAGNLAVLPGSFGWSDVGSFAALPEVRPADARGNVVSGDRALVVDSDGCVVLADKRLIAVVGMKDVVVVDSGDALLVVPKEKSQDVRKAVEELKARKLERFL